MKLITALLGLTGYMVICANAAQMGMQDRMAVLFGDDKRGAAGEGVGDDIDSTQDFFDQIDATVLGRKDCTNQEEINHCVEDCEADKDCSAVSQESLCEQDCLVLCKYLDHWAGRKCVNHLIAHTAWYRDFGNESSGKVKVKPVRNVQGFFASEGEKVQMQRDAALDEEKTNADQANQEKDAQRARDESAPVKSGGKAKPKRAWALFGK